MKKKQLDYREVMRLFNDCTATGGLPDSIVMTRRGIRSMLRTKFKWDKNKIRRYMYHLTKGHELRHEDWF